MTEVPRRLSADEYAGSYQADYGFEQVMVRARRQVIAGLVRTLRPRVVVEVGCGADLLARAMLTQPSAPERWVVVEPSHAFASRAADARSELPGLAVVQGYLEDVTEAARLAAGVEPDLVICSSLLHEVLEVSDFLGAVRSLCRASTVVHVNVPNALSMHRRLARAMGLVASEHEFSQRNQRLGQQRVLTMESLRAAMLAHGFDVIGEGGYLMKPFTHEQMTQIPFLNDSMIGGLMRLGEELPALASEIFVNTRLSSTP